MSDKKQDKKIVEPKKVVPTTKQTESKFYVYELREHSRELFRVRPEVFDGALFDYPDTQITKSDAERRIRAFLAKEAKQ
ncbi:hypothetical protein ACE106_15320 [Shouchella clausii]|uniref:hypothetical protein n=1 Tax=Shouchella clausii TaxID=79880 RepID=UPI00289806CD|nr:hypothetical protein [Shouchella clausii]